MAKAPKVSAPPAPTPPPAIDETVPVVEGEGVPAPAPAPAPTPTPVPDDGTVPVGQGAGNKLPDDVETTEDDGEPVQPEIGGEPIAQTAQEERVASGEAVEAGEEQDAMAAEAFASLKDEPFDPSTNLGDWDGDGRPGGSAPAAGEKEDADKSNVELAEEIAVAHAERTYGDDSVTKPTRSQIKGVIDEHGKGKLPNGNAIDDEFWTAYDQAYDRELLQLEADGLSEGDRIVRIEKTLGLLSPRA